MLRLYGHETMRRRLRDAHARGSLPASILLHGPRGIGKQRLALWLAQMLLCSAGGERPCGECAACRYTLQLGHPDLRWVFPHERFDLDAKADAKEVFDAFGELLVERAEASGLYAPPSGALGIYVVDVRALVHHAALTPALGPRKVIVVGDADAMAGKSGDDAASNTFLKLLEEPPADTTIILTTSEIGELLPTIRSRVIAMRVAPMPDHDVRAWLEDPAVAAALDALDVPKGAAARVELAAGAPGTLLGVASRELALTNARRLLAAATADRATRLRTAFGLGGSRARGTFTDSLDALTGLLHQRARDALAHDDPRAAAAAGRAIDAVQHARVHAGGNVNPQLLGAALLARIGRELS